MDMICETRVTPTNQATHFYGYDGHGNVRFLTDTDGVITDGWDYDLPSPQGSGQTGAFGNIITRSGTTVNHLLYCGEYLDPDLGLYFLRARYMETDRGRFWTMDVWEGAKTQPLSRHRYLFAMDNPTTYLDPSGERSLVELTVVGFAMHTVAAMAQPTPGEFCKCLGYNISSTAFGSYVTAQGVRKVGMQIKGVAVTLGPPSLCECSVTETGQAVVSRAIPYYQKKILGKGRVPVPCEGATDSLGIIIKPTLNGSWTMSTDLFQTWECCGSGKRSFAVRGFGISWTRSFQVNYPFVTVTAP